MDESLSMEYQSISPSVVEIIKINAIGTNQSPGSIPTNGKILEWPELVAVAQIRFQQDVHQDTWLQKRRWTLDSQQQRNGGGWK